MGLGLGSGLDISVHCHPAGTYMLYCCERGEYNGQKLPGQHNMLPFVD